MKEWYNNTKANWKELLSDKKFLVKYLFNFLVCYSVYMLLVQFLVWNRLRPGVVLDDPIQHLFEPYDFSFPTFMLTYLCIILYVGYLVSRPRDFYYGVRAFTAVFVARAAFIYLVPLTPPTQAIVLKDPFLDSIIWGNILITNDLFFSGHVADICIFIYLSRSDLLRYFMMACAVVVGIMLVWQHVHYTADVIASPFFAYVAYTVFAKEYIRDTVSPTFKESQQLFSPFLSRKG